MWTRSTEGSDIARLSWLRRLFDVMWRSGTVRRSDRPGKWFPFSKKGTGGCAPIIGSHTAVEQFTSFSPFGRLLEDSREFAHPVFMCFVDLEKAYDCVLQGILWGVLREYGVPGLLLQAICSLYNQNESCIHILDTSNTFLVCWPPPGLRTRSWIQAAEMSFLCRVAGRTLSPAPSHRKGPAKVVIKDASLP